MKTARLRLRLSLFLFLCLCPTSPLARGVPAPRTGAALADLEEDARRSALASVVTNRGGMSNWRPPPGDRALVRRVPKRAQPASRFALSLDVPTSILSVLIDLAKNQDLRTKAAANAQLMARIGKRKENRACRHAVGGGRKAADGEQTFKALHHRQRE
ncbi:urocortin-3-like [Hippocampus zosterae]|uniref:urocortin-3-like n=1 Tax=Hippocampus zosterae TaxID=109293 RepID=UPI00223E550D|nr:urocortin-3-like [Hippocampus zosterae]XP_051931885.1 urocortin-3-like [Hippocampus zosterae]